MPAIPWVIVPTFNEAENIEAIVAAIRSSLHEAAPEGYRIVIVDDSLKVGTMTQGIAGMAGRVP